MVKPKTQKMKIDAIVFDFDGVLVESVNVKTQAFAQLYSPFGLQVKEKVVEHHTNNAGISRYVKFRHYHKVFLNKALSQEEETELGKEFSKLVVDAIITAPWVPGAHEFLEEVHTRLPLFVASGTPEIELKEIVSRRKMNRFFASVHGTPASKGEIILSIVEKHSFSPNRVLMVGDALADLDGAKMAGVKFLGRIVPGSPAFPTGTDLTLDLFSLPQFLQM